MYNVRFVDSKGNELLMGHLQSNYVITSLSGIDGVTVNITTSQGFGQIGEQIDNMSVGSRQIGLIGKIYNFLPSQLKALNNMFSPRTTVRMYFEEKYWIDVAVKSAPVYTHDLRAVTFAVYLIAAYPYWRNVTKSYYRLGGSSGGFNFPISYDEPHNFALFDEELLINCLNTGNTETDYIIEVACTSGAVENVTITNAQTQQFVRVNTEITAADTVRIYREDNILRVTKTTGGIEQDIFSQLDENSDLEYLAVGDNVLRAEAESGDGRMVVAVSFYNTATGVFYGI